MILVFMQILVNRRIVIQYLYFHFFIGYVTFQWSSYALTIISFRCQLKFIPEYKIIKFFFVIKISSSTKFWLTNY
jgi:hypothetical protein